LVVHKVDLSSLKRVLIHLHAVWVGGHSDSGVREIAIAFSLVMVANDLLWSLPGGVWYLMRFKALSRVSEAGALS
jgi:hypothetical protein